MERRWFVVAALFLLAIPGAVASAGVYQTVLHITFDSDLGGFEISTYSGSERFTSTVRSGNSAYVKEVSPANNYGSSTNLEVGRVPINLWESWAYVELPDDPRTYLPLDDEVVLVLRGLGGFGTSKVCESSFPFDEGTLTWDNRPGEDAALSGDVEYTSGDNRFPLSGYARYVVVLPSALGEGTCTYGSDDHPVIDARPLVEYSYGKIGRFNDSLALQTSTNGEELRAVLELEEKLVVNNGTLVSVRLNSTADSRVRLRFVCTSGVREFDLVGVGNDVAETRVVNYTFDTRKEVRRLEIYGNLDDGDYLLVDDILVFNCTSCPYSGGDSGGLSVEQVAAVAIVAIGVASVGIAWAVLSHSKKQDEHGESLEECLLTEDPRSSECAAHEERYGINPLARQTGQ